MAKKQDNIDNRKLRPDLTIRNLTNNSAKLDDVRKKMSDTRKRLISEGKIDSYRKKNETLEKLFGKDKADAIKNKISINQDRTIFLGKTNPAKRLEVREKIRLSKLREKNPAWNNGSSYKIDYSDNFGRIFKVNIRKRDNYLCIKCGKHQEKEKRSLSVHHINYDKKLTIPENCVSLCHKCHSEVNANRQHWTIFFQSILSEKYGYKYTEDKEVILEVINPLK